MYSTTFHAVFTTKRIPGLTTSHRLTVWRTETGTDDADESPSTENMAYNETEKIKGAWYIWSDRISLNWSGVALAVTTNQLAKYAWCQSCDEHEDSPPSLWKRVSLMLEAAAKLASSSIHSIGKCLRLSDSDLCWRHLSSVTSESWSHLESNWGFKKSCRKYSGVAALPKKGTKIAQYYS